MTEQLQAPLFRGATKPIMVWGVPMNAFILATMPSVIIFIMFYDVLGYFSILLAVPIFIGVPVMREITKQDDQYLNMWQLDLKERHGMTVRNRIDGVIVIPPHSLRHQRFIKD